MTTVQWFCRLEMINITKNTNPKEAISVREDIDFDFDGNQPVWFQKPCTRHQKKVNRQKRFKAHDWVPQCTEDHMYYPYQVG